MDQHHFLIHGSIHGITADTMDHLRRFARAGGHVEMLPGQTDAVISYALPVSIHAPDRGLHPARANLKEAAPLPNALYSPESGGFNQESFDETHLHETEIIIESLLHILESAGENAHGVITYGWSHQEPSHLHLGAAKSKTGSPSLWDALKSIHRHSWFAKRSVRHEQNH